MKSVERELNEQYILSVTSERIANLSDWNLAEMLAEKELQEKELSVEQNFPDYFRKKLDQVKRNRALAERRLLRYYTRQRPDSLAEDVVAALRSMQCKSSRVLETMLSSLKRAKHATSIVKEVETLLEKTKRVEKEIEGALRNASVTRAIRLLEENKIDPTPFEYLARELYERLSKRGSPLARALRESFLKSVKKTAELRLVRIGDVEYIARPAAVPIKSGADFEYLRLAVGELRKRGSTDEEILSTLTDPEKTLTLFKELFPSVYTDAVPFCFGENVVRSLLQ